MIDDDGEIVRAPFVRSAFNYNGDKVSEETGLRCLDATRTQQQFAEESDINTIVRKFGLTGELPEPGHMPQSGDFTETVNDYQTALHMVIAADRAFMEFPAELRDRFHNDPGRMIKFIEDDKNRDEARKLGILKPEPPKAEPPEPMLVRVVPDPKPAPSGASVPVSP